MTEAYRVGVTFALNNLVSAELARIAAQFTSTNRAAKELHGTLMSFATVGVLAAGVAVAATFKASIDEARRFQTEVSRFSAMGFGDAITSQAVKAAKAMDVMGQSYTDNMELIREATGVTGDPRTGMQMATQLAKFQSGLTSYLGADKARDASGMMMAAMKTSELRGDVLDRNTGKFQADRFGADLDAMQQVFISSGGLVTPQQLLSFIKTGGVAAKGLSSEAFFFQEAHGIQESGGQRAGTSLMSNYQNLAMGRASQAVIQQLMDMGLLDARMVEMNQHTGRPSKMKAGALADALGFLNSQFDWFEKNIEPQLKGLSQSEAIAKISTISSNRTAMNRNVQFYLERENIQKGVALGHRAMGVNGLYDKESQTNQALVNDLTAKWKDLMIELGTKVLPTVNKVLEAINLIVTDWTAWLKAGNDAKTQGMPQHSETYNFLAGMGDLASSAWSKVTAPAPQRNFMGNQVTVVQIDGREVGRAVTKQQADFLQSATSSGSATSGVDWNQAALYPSMAYGVR